MLESRQLSFCAADPDKGHARAIETFIDQIKGATPTLCDVDSAILATRVAFAAIRSAQDKRFVRIEEV
jgi:predicted dehydrogenase